MLTITKRFRKLFRNIVGLLFFISCLTFHTLVSADIKEQTAEEYRALGYEQQQKGNLNEALTYYTKAVSLGAVGNAVLLNDMGVLYEKIDYYARAQQYYQMAIEADDHYLPPYINLAYLYQMRGEKRKAAQFFKKRYELGDPADPWAQKAKEELLKIRPDYREWTASIEADALNKQLVAKSRDEFYQRVKRSQEHYHKGEAFFKDGDHKNAMMEYDAAMRLAPKSPKIINARKKVILEMTKKSVRDQSEQAIKWLEAGDTLSARHEIQKILTIIPKEPMLISR